MKSKIWLSSPHMGGSEFGFVKDAFDTNWIAPLGPSVDGFEKDIEQYLESDVHVAALSSGTAALHLALILCGVRAGDEVVCQSMTFAASANPIVYLGAKPIFIDSEVETWNMCPSQLRRALEDRASTGVVPKAIIAVHLYGMPAKMHEILEVGREYNIPVIEDAAEALGSRLHQEKCGSFGACSILSFNGNKIITTSGGGALVSHDAEMIRKARFLATQARDPAPHYEHSSIGYNYRMSNVCASIGRGQMEVIDQRVEQRRRNFEFYRDTLCRFRGIEFLAEPRGHFSNRWLTTIIIDPANSGGITRETIRVAMENENIESRPLWKPLHLQPVFSNALYFGNGVSEKLFQHGLCLPSGSNLTDEDRQRVVAVFDKVLS